MGIFIYRVHFDDTTKSNPWTAWVDDASAPGTVGTELVKRLGARAFEFRPLTPEAAALYGHPENMDFMEHPSKPWVDDTPPD